jgi:uncharacterized LabA/DUF88 family protein
MSDRYLFIDGGHLRYYRETVRKWFGEEPEIQYDFLRTNFSALKCFYYDCLDDIQRTDETDQKMTERIARQKSELSRIRSFPGTHVRLGSLVGEENTKRQKEVDILLAVDMLNHAARQNAKQMTLLSGDRDFRPVIESLVQMGIYVEVAGDARHTSSVLSEAADYYRQLTISDYFQWSSLRQQTAFPIPTIGLTTTINLDGYRPVKEGILEGATVELHHKPGQYLFIIKKSSDEILFSTFGDEERLLAFCDLRFNKIIWK